MPNANRYSYATARFAGGEPEIDQSAYASSADGLVSVDNPLRGAPEWCHLHVGAKGFTSCAVGGATSESLFLTGHHSVFRGIIGASAGIGPSGAPTLTSDLAGPFHPDAAAHLIQAAEVEPLLCKGFGLTTTCKST